ncbi:uncharacterized protein LOC128972319 [Indicator indicator]|uniref:uncharacterized protein LOC128972319 n=1 Tax=Indicator indicator TaxID=1002788 RepID=UPI0023DFEB12|nr:uncharacterized protein LOC128972319 [Indicator indicator]
MQPGDIVLVPIQSSVSLYPIFKHAAVYIGDGEVIHFQGLQGKSGTGRISKEGFPAMKDERGKFQIWRKRGGVDLDDFDRKVKNAMQCKAKYHLSTNNCIHFALWLLGLADFYMELVEIQEEVDKGKAVSIPKVEIEEVDEEEAVEISDEDGREEAMSIPSDSPSRQGSGTPWTAAVLSKGFVLHHERDWQQPHQPEHDQP